jgi:hypothetical protein
MDSRIYRLRTTLRGLRPAVWRRIEVPSDLSLFELHRVIQGAMGWTDAHLHQFVHRGLYYGAPDREFGLPTISERRTRLHDLLQRPKDRLIYEYDFGDSWEHEVVLEAVEYPQAGVRYPRWSLVGARALPKTSGERQGTRLSLRPFGILITMSIKVCWSGSAGPSIPNGSTLS